MSQPEKSNSARSWLLLLAVAFIVLVVIVSCNLEPSAPPVQAAAKKIELTPAMKSAVDNLLANNLARVDVQLRKAWVDSDLWRLADAAAKEEIAATFSIYFADLNRSDLYYSEIFDKQSGKRLAKHSQSFGFKID